MVANRGRWPTRHFGRALLIVLLILMGASATGAQHSPTCLATVIADTGGNLPVKAHYTWQSGDTGHYVSTGQLIQVTRIALQMPTGQIWFKAEAGWLQAYSGYTTGKTQIIMADVVCPSTLPVLAVWQD